MIIWEGNFSLSLYLLKIWTSPNLEYLSWEACLPGGWVSTAKDKCTSLCPNRNSFKSLIWVETKCITNNLPRFCHLSITLLSCTHWKRLTSLVAIGMDKNAYNSFQRLLAWQLLLKSALFMDKKQCEKSKLKWELHRKKEQKTSNR